MEFLEFEVSIGGESATGRLFEPLGREERSKGDELEGFADVCGPVGYAAVGHAAVNVVEFVGEWPVVFVIECGEGDVGWVARCLGVVRRWVLNRGSGVQG